MPEDLNALDTELTELLAVEPSPQFAAKVRARIERQPAASFVWRWWLGVPVAAAAVIMIAVAIVGHTPRVQFSAPAHTDVRLPPPVHPVAPFVAMTPKMPPHTAALHAPNPKTEPETLVDPSIAAAVRRLATDQRVLPEMPAEASLDPVVVEPLKVPEIADSGAKQGDRQ